MPDSKVKPTPYEAALKKDAAPFDSVPGVGFNSDPAVGRHRAACRAASRDRVRSWSSIRRRTTRSARSTARGSRAPPCRRAPGVRMRRFATRSAGCPTARRTTSSQSLALQAERHAVRRRAGADAQAAHRPLSSRGPAAWTRAGRAGCSSSTASRSSRSTPRTSSRRSPDKIDVLIIADDARVPLARRGAADAAGAQVAAGARGGARPPGVRAIS